MSMVNSILGPIARLGLTLLSRRRLPQIHGRLFLPGLRDEVEVLRDRWGIPHIYAKNDQDLFFGQGFVHAQDRLWQMEMNRRAARGKLSELFGELALDTDRVTRTFGFHRLGQADWDAADADIRQVIEAYTAGVNAFLNHPQSKLPVEFTLLRHTPEPWRPEDSASFARLMIWQLSHAWYGEILRAKLAETVGEAQAAELEILYPEANPSILPEGIEFNQLDAVGLLKKAQGPFLNRGLGSNAWAVSGSRSVSGQPYLCNDMHLPLSIPSLWYEAHLIGGGLNVSGVTLPGLPLIMVGHNTRIAWGMTLAFTDCEDLFVEQMDVQNPRRYRYGDEWLVADVIKEPIQVKGRDDPYIEQVFVTQHGPIISEMVDYPEKRVAVNSMALRPSSAFRGWLWLNRAHDWDDFVSAMHLIEAPQLAVTYADVDGNIGYWTTGKVPVRAKGDGTIPVPGWTKEWEWVDEVPFNEMPHALNPQKGFIVTCNHRVVPDSYPHFLGKAWMNGYRAKRIEQVLASKPKLSPEEFRALQLDFTCLPGLEFVSKLEKVAFDDEDAQLALKELRQWDGVLSTDTIGGTIYEVARYTMIRHLLENWIGEDLTSRLMGQGFHPLLMPSNEFLGHDTTTLLRLLEDPDSRWIEHAGGLDLLIKHTLKDAVGWLRSEVGPDPEDWTWGRLHHVIFEHPLGLQKPLDQVFNRGPRSIGGDTDTPCQTAMLPQDPYDNKAWGPSHRQIMDLGDLSRSVAITPTGQSGHLGSPHYDDFIDPWLNGAYHPMLWTREQIEAEIEGALILKPE